MTQPREPMTYAAAGVNINEGSRAVELIKSHVRSTFRPEVMGDIGFFGGLFRLGSSYRDPVLVSSADGVGTKLKVAIALDRHDTIGRDLVNHCINDIFVGGAEPLFFLDYFATGRLVPEHLEQVVKGMAAACRDAGCTLIGGETAEMPDMYGGDDYDLAGFIVGVVERDGIIDGSAITPGDVLLGLPSTGLHTNGYSLARRVFDLGSSDVADRRILERREPALGGAVGDALLAVHRPYYPLLRPALPVIKGMAHITGGGLIENVPRILPAGVAARFRLGSWPVLPIFSLLQDRGGVAEREMYRVFNMGVGLVIACAPDDVASIQAVAADALVVGEIVPRTGDERVVLV
jgi:phosphoribosylformylglycinamidine cyclo-ligase